MRTIFAALLLLALTSAAYASGHSTTRAQALDEKISIYDVAPANCRKILPISATNKDRDKAFLKLLSKADKYGGNAITKYKERNEGFSYRMEADVLECN